MTSANQTSRLLAPVERLVAMLTDPARRERAIIGVLIAYTAIWTLYGVLSNAHQDLHYDMVELFSMSHQSNFGSAKHPSFPAIVAAAWFAIFPATDWAYYLLAVSVAAFTLWIFWRLSARFFDDEKRVFGLALLTLVPFYNFHALRYNHNSILLPLWAVATLWFLRSVETLRVSDAAIAGLAAAAAMYGKYWSVFLLSGLGIAALVNPGRAAYFRSAAPWVTITVGALFVAPSAMFLIANDFAAGTYAFALHGSGSFAETLYGIFKYLVGGIAYIALPLMLAVVATRPSRAALGDMLWPEDAHRRLISIIFWATLLSPIVAAILTSFVLTSLWTMSAWTLLPIVFLSSPLILLRRRAVVEIVALAVVFPLLMILAAPAVAVAIHSKGHPVAAHSRLLAERVAHEWRQTSDRLLRFVSGNADLAYGVAFYSKYRPSVISEFTGRTLPQVANEQIARDGIALVCFAQERECIIRAEAQAAGAPGSRHADVEIVRSHFGIAGRPTGYVIITIPPRF